MELPSPARTTGEEGGHQDRRLADPRRERGPAWTPHRLTSIFPERPDSPAAPTRFLRAPSPIVQVPAMLSPAAALLLSATLCTADLPNAYPPPTPDSLRLVYNSAATWDDFHRSVDARPAMWAEHRDNVVPHADLVERAGAVGGSWRILAIAVAGCSDSIGTLPCVAGLADSVPSLDFRVADPADGQRWMDAFPSPDGRATTPTILLLDEDYEIRGCWIEMPATVWAFWQPALHQGEASRMLDHKMAWYLEDQGRETLTDLVEILEAASRGEVICPGM